MPSHDAPAASRPISRARWLELLAVFALGPVPVALLVPSRFLFPSIWALVVVCIALERALPDRRPASRPPPAHTPARWLAELPRILSLFILAAIALTVALWLYNPARLLILPRERPEIMALIAILYPLLSVVPQEFAFRAFFFRRYEPILGQGHAIRFANALLFGWAHIVMHNALAVGLSILGGYLFALTYQRTRSLRAVCIEHALYGVFLFFIGWGSFFFAGVRDS